MNFPGNHREIKQEFEGASQQKIRKKNEIMIPGNIDEIAVPPVAPRPRQG